MTQQEAVMPVQCAARRCDEVCASYVAETASSAPCSGMRVGAAAAPARPSAVRISFLTQASDRSRLVQLNPPSTTACNRGRVFLLDRDGVQHSHKINGYGFA